MQPRMTRRKVRSSTSHGSRSGHPREYETLLILAADFSILKARATSEKCFSPLVAVATIRLDIRCLNVRWSSALRDYATQGATCLRRVGSFVRGLESLSMSEDEGRVRADKFVHLWCVKRCVGSDSYISIAADTPTISRANSRLVVVHQRLRDCSRRRWQS